MVLRVFFFFSIKREANNTLMDIHVCVHEQRSLVKYETDLGGLGFGYIDRWPASLFPPT